MGCSEISIPAPQLFARAPACESCGADGASHIWSLSFKDHAEPFHLWRCRDCRVVFNSPRLSEQALHGQYDGNYYVFAQPAARRWMRAAQIYVEHLLPLENGVGRRLLDVGCARGDLLAIAAARGWRVQGIELSEHAAKQARSEHQIEVRVGTLEQHQHDMELFDVVVATDVIEHVPSPARFLRCVHAMLRPGGRALIETPNWGSMWRRLAGPRWLGVNRFHIFLFDAAALQRIMTRCGFSNCRIAASTHAAYSEWGVRPELAPALDALPAALRWRAQKLLSAITPPCPSVRIKRLTPSSLAEALHCVETLSSRRARRPTHPFWHDNLAVIGRA